MSPPHIISYTYDNDNRFASVTAGTASRIYVHDNFSQVSPWVAKHNGSALLKDGLSYRDIDSATTGQVEELTSQASGFWNPPPWKSTAMSTPAAS